MQNSSNPVVTGGERVALFGMPLDIKVQKCDLLERISSGVLLLSYLNPYAYSVINEFPNYISDLTRFDLVVCDGVGIQIAVKSVFKTTTPILTPDGSGVGGEYLELGANRNMSLCMVGSDSETIGKAAAALRVDYPGYREITEFSGFGDSLTQAKAFILKSAPELVLVGLGMGRQEAYLLDLVDSGWQGVGICVGGFFDKIADPKMDYPEWAKKTRLRFLSRLIREPHRLSRRYFVEYQPFIKMYIKHLIK